METILFLLLRSRAASLDASHSPQKMVELLAALLLLTDLGLMLLHGVTKQ